MRGEYYFKTCDTNNYSNVFFFFLFLYVAGLTILTWLKIYDYQPFKIRITNLTHERRLNTLHNDSGNILHNGNNPYNNLN